ncbi:MAG TPA: 3'(2'),5'-bisphosphate nucleotidase CysQ [Gammaproteobacteria bacterium]|nr:3'(2'),5'-bisphosphate nucleotidase CysQ [Gammaproteobacteria bacterium]
MAEGFLSPLLEIAERAGKRIMEVYDTDFAVSEKADESPLTQADLRAHRVIVDGLQELTPDIPVLSEESAAIPWGERRHWERYWLVDPLDGTREFVKRNGEFTVNIALIEHHRPIAGVVHVPVTGVSYLGAEGAGAFRREAGGTREIHVQQPAEQPPRVVASRSHRGEAVDAWLARLGEHRIVSMGSSLKLCLIAEGAADAYPRLGPTSEWDTAAAHAVICAAGGAVVEAATGKPLRYNTKETLLNPWFIAYGDANRDWLLDRAA